MEKEIKVVVIDKNLKNFREVMTIRNDLKVLQDIVGGWIEVYPAASDLLVICNEEGRLNNMPYTATIAGEQFFGPLILCGQDGDEFASIPEKYI